jgi:hypothetical protein
LTSTPTEFSGQQRQDVFSNQQYHIPFLPVARNFHGVDSSCTLRQACELLLSSTITSLTTTLLSSTTAMQLSASSSNKLDFLQIAFLDDVRVSRYTAFTTI